MSDDAGSAIPINPLAAWCSQHGMSRVQAAEALGVPVGRVRFWETGDFAPDLKDLDGIRKLTEGAVTADMYLDWYMGQRERRAT